MRDKLKALSWYHITRAVALVLIFFAVAIENDPGNRGTYITAAIGLLAAEPVGRRERALPPRNGKERE